MMLSDIIYFPMNSENLFSFSKEYFKYNFSCIKKIMGEILNGQNEHVKNNEIMQIDKEFSIEKVESKQYDILIIDDSERWQDIIKETFDNIYTFDITSNYDNTVDKINDNVYKVICLSKPFKKWRYLLLLIKNQYPETPVIILNSSPDVHVNNIQARYPNIKKIISKEDSNMVSELTNFILSLFNDKRRSK